MGTSTALASEQQNLFAAAVESANAAFVITALDGTILSWNRAAERMFGYSAKEAVGKNIAITTAPEQREEQRQNFERVCRGERIIDLETIRTAKDGRTIDVSLTMSPILGPSGDIIGISEIKRDIGRRKFNQERFRVAVEASPGAMIMADEHGHIQMVNAEAERMFGYDRSELLGQPIETLLPGRLREHEQDRSDDSKEPSRRSMGAGRDLFALRKDGSEFAVQIGLNPITTRSGRMVMAAIVDITERKKQEELLSQRARELERSNAELEQFAYVASHDLQEPLRMVASYAELLAERYSGKLDAKADKYIQYAVDGAKRMQRLVNDLLAYSRVGRRDDTLKPTNTQRIVERVLKDLDHAVAKAEATVDVGLLPVIVADDGQIAQVFQNLIGNALKFKAADRPNAISVRARQTGEGWLFSIEDQGIGIEAQYSERIFQMFQRLHDRQTYDGTGIGLTIAKKIVERHGGKIWFESVPGQGTTFYFTLPQTAEKTEKAA